MKSDEYKSITFLQIPLGLATACTLDENNPHILYLDECNGFQKDGEIFVYCEVHEGYVKLEKAEEEQKETNFTRVAPASKRAPGNEQENETQ